MANTLYTGRIYGIGDGAKHVQYNSRTNVVRFADPGPEHRYVEDGFSLFLTAHQMSKAVDLANSLGEGWAINISESGANWG